MNWEQVQVIWKVPVQRVDAVQAQGERRLRPARPASSRSTCSRPRPPRLLSVYWPVTRGFASLHPWLFTLRRYAAVQWTVLTVAPVH
jgi:hypothetical protein